MQNKDENKSKGASDSKRAGATPACKGGDCKGAHPAAPTPHAAMRTVAYSPGDDTKRVVPQSAHPGMAPAAIVPIIAPGIMRFSDGRATAEELDDSSSELLQMQ